MDKNYLDLISSMVLELDSNGKIIFINKPGAKMLGYKVKELIGADWFEKFIEKDERKEVKRVFKKIIAGDLEPVENYENKVLRKDGVKLIVNWHNTYLKEGGEIVGSVSVGEDITEIKKMERELKDREEKYHMIIESTDDLIYSYGLDRKLNFISSNVSKYGYSVEEIVGKDLYEFVHPDDLERVEKDIKKFFKSGQTILTEVRIKKKNGEYFWVEEKGKPIEKDGKFVGVAGMMRDIDDRKKALEEAKESQQILQNIIDVLPSRIFWKDKDLSYLGCNMAFAKDAGMDGPKEVIGKSDYDMPWKDRAELYRADDMRILKSGEPKINYEELQTTSEGNKIYLLTSKLPLKECDKVKGIIGTYLDITESKRAKAEVEKINEFSVGRELKMIELKKEVNSLLKKLNEKPKYDN